LSDPWPRFQGHGVIFNPIDALSVLCAQLTRDMLAIAKFLLTFEYEHMCQTDRRTDGRTRRRC